jgi:hypothetical protein
LPETPSVAYDSSKCALYMHESCVDQFPTVVSRWERESPTPLLECSDNGVRTPHLRKTETRRSYFPLPTGEGSRVRESVCFFQTQLQLLNHCRTAPGSVTSTWRPPSESAAAAGR